MPWVMTEDSRATTGHPSAKAARTSSAISKTFWWASPAMLSSSDIIVNRVLRRLRSSALRRRPGRHAVPRQDLDRRGPPRHEAHARRHAVEGDSHRHALRQAHPAEGRVDIGEKIAAPLAFAIGDAAGDALDMPVDECALAHEVHPRRRPDLDARQLGL